MRNRTVLLSTIGLLVFVALSSLASEVAWSSRINGSDPLRLLVGLPSTAIGNLNPSARNPGLELLCTSLYDVPGGYCYYFTPGAPYSNIITLANVTLGGTK